MTSRPARRPSRMAVSLLVLGGLAAGLAAGEAAFRMIPPRERKQHVVSDPVFHHRFKPNARTRVAGQAYAINSLGFRDREIAVPKPDGLFRILMLGDSFTEGWGLAAEDTMPKRVEEIFRRSACAKPVEVVNAGIGSYSPILQYLQLERVGFELSPDLVVLNFDMTDVHDDWVRTQMAHLDRDGLPVAVPADRRRETMLLLPPLARVTTYGPGAALERTMNRLLVYQRLRRSKVGQRLLGPVDLSSERLAALGLIGDIHYDVEGITRDVETASVRAAWRLTERYVTGIHALAHRRRVRFALVVYPHAQQVAADESPIGRRRHGVEAGLHASRRPFDVLEALGHRAGFPVINLLERFRARRAVERPLFRLDDLHHTPAGARVFAEGVAAGLIEQHLAPCRM